MKKNLVILVIALAFVSCKAVYQVPTYDSAQIISPPVHTGPSESDKKLPLNIDMMKYWEIGWNQNDDLYAFQILNRQIKGDKDNWTRSISELYLIDKQTGDIKATPIENDNEITETLLRPFYNLKEVRTKTGKVLGMLFAASSGDSGINCKRKGKMYSFDGSSDVDAFFDGKTLSINGKKAYKCSNKYGWIPNKSFLTPDGSYLCLSWSEHGEIFFAIETSTGKIHYNTTPVKNTKGLMTAKPRVINYAMNKDLSKIAVLFVDDKGYYIEIMDYQFPV